MNKLRTPFIKPREQGGTFYTFPSAMEDIGVNINETRNKVALSHYMLLNIPKFTHTSILFRTINDRNYAQMSNPNTFVYNHPGDYTFAESLQNYSFNFETMLRNQSTYNFSLSTTVSERAFWKWLQKVGMLQLVQDSTKPGYYREKDDSSSYSRVCKCIGQISSGAQRSDESGIYNETFVQIPSSYGDETVYFKKYEDGNYDTKTYSNPNWQDDHIQYVENTEYNPQTGVLNATGLVSNAIYDSNRSYTVDSSQSMIAVLDIDELQDIYNGTINSFDDIAINNSYSNNGNFDFNAILVYYSVYDNDSGKILSTNAYGLLVLDHSEDNSGTYYFKALNKIKSSKNVVGTSYSFRLNIKTTSVYNVSDITIEDQSTAAYSMSTDFNDTIKNLNACLNTLRSNAALIYNLNKSNTVIKELAANAISKVDDLGLVVNNLSTNLLDVPNKPCSDTLKNYSGLQTILDNINVAYDSSTESFNIQVVDDPNISDATTKTMYRNIKDTNGEINFYNLLALILAKLK